MEEENTFINEYILDENSIKETMGSWWDRRFKKLKVFSIILFLISIIAFILSQDLRWLLVTFLSVYMIVLCVIKKKTAIKTEISKMKVLYKDEKIQIKIILDKKIKLLAPKNEKEIDFSDIEYMIDSENFITLNIKGNMTISLKKDGFTKGNITECVKYLNEVIKTIKN